MRYDDAQRVRTWSAKERSQFDQAVRFLRQAEARLSNLDFAYGLAADVRAVMRRAREMVRD